MYYFEPIIGMCHPVLFQIERLEIIQRVERTARTERLETTKITEKQWSYLVDAIQIERIEITEK